MLNLNNKYRVIGTEKELNTLIEYCKQTRIVSFDFETKAAGPQGSSYTGDGDDNPSGFQYDEDEPTIIGISFQIGYSYIIPLSHPESPFMDRSKYPTGYWKVILKKLSTHLFENTGIIKVGQNLKFEHKWLLKYGCELKGYLFDTMLAKYILNEEKPHGLKPMVAHFFPKFAGYDDEISSLVRQYKGWGNIPLKPLSKYCAMDADFTLRLQLILERKLIEQGLYDVFRNLIMTAHRVLTRAEWYGIRVNRSYLEQLVKDTDKNIKSIDSDIRNLLAVRKFERRRLKAHLDNLIEAAEEKVRQLKKQKATPKQIDNAYKKVTQYIQGDLITKKEILEPLNFASPKQMREFLFTKAGLNLEPVKTTDSGEYSTDEETLLKLKAEDDSGFIDLLLKYREISKLYSTYMVSVLNKVTNKDKIHSSFLIHGTVTGRLSSKNPNLQNIPRDTTSSLIKKMFIPSPGRLMMQLDYSQAELRVMSEMANEKSMQEWFNIGRDVHLATACKKWGFDYDKAAAILADENHKDYKTWKVRRKQAKTINFGIIYEEGPGKLAEGLSDPNSGYYVDEEEAREFLSDYFKTFPNVKKFINNQHKLAEQQGYVRNLFGRKRRLPDIYLKMEDFGAYLRAQRQSTNAPVQGTASDFALFSSVLIYYGILKGELPYSLIEIFTVHDSLGFEVLPKHIHKITPVLNAICENPETQKWFGFSMKKVRMKVDFEVSPTDWGSLKKYDSKVEY